MSIEIKNIKQNKSLLNRSWELKEFDERKTLKLSQQFNLKYIVAKLLNIRDIDHESFESFLDLINGTSAPNLIAIFAIFSLSVETIILLNKFDFFAALIE